MENVTLKSIEVQTLEDFQPSLDYVKNLRERVLLQELKDFIKSDFDKTYGKVCLLYGLRRTGKTTMIFQSIAQMSQENQKKSVYINCTEKDTVVQVVRDIQNLYKNGFMYFFLDEVTKMEDFAALSSLFADNLAKKNIKIVLSGTDSLSLWLAKSSALFDRTKIIHTTMIPFYEFKILYPNATLDDFIEYGGTLSHESDGLGYFQSEANTYEYIDSAICDNILHSLAYYEKDGAFSDLYPYYSKNELKNIIHRIFQRDSHEFTEKVVYKRFKMADYNLTRNNLARRGEFDTVQAMDEQDTESILQFFKDSISVFDRNEKTNALPVYREVMLTLKNYLDKLDIVQTIPVVTATDSSISDPIIKDHVVLAQPGIRYSEAKSLVDTLAWRSTLNRHSESTLLQIENEILNAVKGKLLEDLILLNTQKALGDDFKVFQLQFNPVYGVVQRQGEFDMIVYQKSTNECSIFEIKHAQERVERQMQHLIDPEKCAWAEQHYGTIVEKKVLYMGPTLPDKFQGVSYQNASDYLHDLLYKDTNYNRWKMNLNPEQQLVWNALQENLSLFIVTKDGNPIRIQKQGKTSEPYDSLVDVIEDYGSVVQELLKKGCIGFPNTVYSYYGLNSLLHEVQKQLIQEGKDPQAFRNCIDAINKEFDEKFTDDISKENELS
ncbi:AAA family ATPase [Faecalicoccus pleomorphus]|uniref:AAA family ATPase n=1 Tax=Faecalicoccus pleomorphus TaxID=1323 RepID=UPI0029423391|nr:AAA family ATPase [Faecalicoccus pleomorphus]